MTQFILDLFFAIVFVLLLILLLKMKERAFHENKESYRYTFFGMTALGFVALMQLAGHQNLFRPLPFLSEPFYLELVQMIGIVAGVSLLAGGISIWLPGARMKENLALEKISRYEVLERIRNFIESQSDTGHLFRQLPRLVCRELNLSAAALLMLNRRSGRIACVGSMNTGDKLEYLTEGFETETLKPEEMMMELTSRVQADFEIKVTVNGSPSGVFLIWKNLCRELSPDEKATLITVGRYLCDFLTARYEVERGAFYREVVECLTAAYGLTRKRAELKEILRDFNKLLNKATGAEFISLALYEKHRKNLRRYTTGINGNVLLDGVVSPPTQNACTDSVIENQRTLQIDDIDGLSQSNVDSLFVSCGQKSLLAVPIANCGKITGVLTLGHPTPGHFGRRETLKAEALAGTLSPVIENELARRANFEHDRYLAAINAFESALENCTDTGTLFNLAAESLMNSVGTTMVRISAIDSGRKELTCKAVRTIRPFENIKTDNVAISKEMTPWHHMVITESRLLLINQEDAESCMSEGEAAALTVSGMRSALVVPIVVNGLTLAVITLAEMREWERFSYDSAAISFCKGMATRVANGIKLIQMSRSILAETERAPLPMPNRMAGQDVFGELKGPLTNLQGSLDLLKIKGWDGEEESGKLFGVIEESANRMISILNEK